MKTMHVDSLLFFLFHFLTIILIVQLTIYVTALALNLFPVTEGGWISTPSWATIMNSRITFTVCLAAAVSNVTSHVSSDTVGCTSIVVCTFLPTWSRASTVNPVRLFNLKVATRIRVHIPIASNLSAPGFNIANATQTVRWNGSLSRINCQDEKQTN